MNSKPKALSVHIISSSHFDREWYMTVEVSRFRLIRCMNRALNYLESDTNWKSYMTDGQTQMVHDYLIACPEAESRIRALAKSGHLQLGPWRVQPDTQIICGEAMIRNLLLGHRDCDKWGGIERHGYLADNFGHVGQIPQILQGFGIKSSSFWRGYDENNISALENRWFSPDGSCILAYLLPRGYASGAGYGPGEGDNINFEKHWPILRQLSLTGKIVLGDGTDHALPTPNLDEVIAFTKKQLPDADFVHQSHWSQVIADINDACKESAIELPELHGELIYASALDGVFSNRINQKQSNQRCESLLCRYAEPLTTLACSAEKECCPQGLLNHAWEMLVKNAAHDSICGCHSDKVARDVEARFDRVEEIAKGVALMSLDSLAGFPALERDTESKSAIVVFNPLPSEFQGIIDVNVEVPDTEGRDGHIGLLTKDLQFTLNGKRLNAEIIEDLPSARPTYGDRHNPFVRNTRKFRALVEIPCIPPLGVNTIHFDSTNKKQQASMLNADDIENDSPEFRLAEKRIVKGHNILENDFIQVSVNADGTLKLINLASGKAWNNLNRIIDEQDCGNLYSFAASKNRRSTSCIPGAIEILHNSNLRGTLRVSTQIPCFDQRSETDFVQRCSGNDTLTRLCPITIDITLNRLSARIEFTVRIDNQSGGHRLRTLFPILEEKQRCRVNSVFDLVDRDRDFLKAIEKKRGITHDQLSELTGQCMAGFQVIDNEAHGIGIASRGLYEYQHNYEEGRVELTLFRSIGSINLGFEAWGTEEKAFCIGQHKLEYAIEPFTGDLYESDLLQSLDAYLNPPLSQAFHESSDIHFTGPSLPDPRLALSAFKRLENGENGLLLRFFNRSEDRINATIPLGRKYQRIEMRRADESTSNHLASNADHVTLNVAPKKIISLALFL